MFFELEEAKKLETKNKGDLGIMKTVCQSQDTAEVPTYHQLPLMFPYNSFPYPEMIPPGISSIISMNMFPQFGQSMEQLQQQQMAMARFPVNMTQFGPTKTVHKNKKCPHGRQKHICKECGGE